MFHRISEERPVESVQEEKEVILKVESRVHLQSSLVKVGVLRFLGG